ncbi:MAG: GDP-mannose 4,6-dehydratase [Candidatus Diapherotrites archaeon]
MEGSDDASTKVKYLKEAFSKIKQDINILKEEMSFLKKETIKKDNSHKKVALITGIGGQDGSYLAEFLLEKGYFVRGIIRRASYPNTHRIDHLLKKYGDDRSEENPFFLLYADLTDASSLRNVIEKIRPDEIYNLAAQSHVGISFENGGSTLNINTLGVHKILDTIRKMNYKCKYYQASSSEMFGSSPPPQNENTPFNPQSPYGISKVAAFHLTKMYREAYGLFACNGILFNHESPRRGLNFVTKKITKELSEMVVGEREIITLGNLDAKRDWGFSGEYVQAMWAILQQESPDDFVISTGEAHTVKEFLDECFSLLGLDKDKFFKSIERYKRPAEVPALLGDSTKAKNILNWDPKVKFKELAKMMLVADLKEKFEQKGIIQINSKKKYSDEFYLKKAKDLLKKYKNMKDIR